MSQAADILLGQFALFSQLGKPQAALMGRGLGTGAALEPDRYNTPIEELSLSVRAYNCLKRSGLMTVGQVLEKSEDELLALRNFGRKSYDEMKSKLIQLGFLQPESLEEEEEMGRAFEEEEEEDESLGSLGTALLQALRKSGKDVPGLGEEESADEGKADEEKAEEGKADEEKEEE